MTLISESSVQEFSFSSYLQCAGRAEAKSNLFAAVFG